MYVFILSVLKKNIYSIRVRSCKKVGNTCLILEKEEHCKIDKGVHCKKKKKRLTLVRCKVTDQKAIK